LNTADAGIVYRFVKHTQALPRPTVWLSGNFVIAKLQTHHRAISGKTHPIRDGQIRCLLKPVLCSRLT